MSELRHGWEYQACLTDIINLAGKGGMDERERRAYIDLLYRVAQYTLKIVAC